MSDRSIAVVMSVYKKENPEYLELSLKSSWTDQVLKPTQIILVEDGELTLELYSVIESWKKKIKDVLVIHKNQTNLGLTKSLNIAIEYVTAKYIARMDSDDISLPERFLKQVNFLEINSDVSVVGSNVQEIDEFGNFTELRKYPLVDEEIREYICKATPLQHSAVMMRSSIFNEGISYNESYKMTQDLALWFSILNEGYKIANIPEVLFLFRITPETFSRRNRSKGFHEFKIYMKGISKLKGMTVKFIYPISRLLMRYMPSKLIKIIYESEIRKKILK